MSKVVLVVNIKIKKEFIEKVVEEFKTIHKFTHELDEGCIQYDYHKVQEKEDSYVFIETWESQELLDIHMKKEHFVKFFEATDGMIENIEMTPLQKIGE